MAIFIITLDATASFLLILTLAVSTVQLSTRCIKFASDHSLHNIIKPDVRDPVYACNVHSSNVGVHNDSLQVAAKDATVSGRIFYLSFCLHCLHRFAPFTKPGLIITGTSLQDFVPITRLMYSYVALIAHH